MQQRFEGIWLPLITPFRDGEVDLPALHGLVEHYIGAGIHGFIVCGTTGEPATMSEDEQLRVLDAVLEVSGGRRPVVMGLSSNDTRDALRQLARFQRRAIDGILAVSPYYTRPSQQGLVAHFHALARATARRDLPVFAVGPQTSAQALRAGFGDVRNADGDANALARCARQWAVPEKGVLLHVCGAQAPGTLAALLRNAGFSVRRAPLYRIEAAADLPDAVLQALRTRQLDAAMFFSPRSAAVFRDCLLRHDGGLAGSLTGLCISTPTAAALAPLAFAAIRIAGRPNQDAMLALVA